jgi:ubiquinone biosynthesis monooxygenase Coq7
MTEPKRPARLPGDLAPDEQIDRYVRVDHAGEYGATRIYAGQLAVLGRGRHGPTLRHMLQQEQEHRRVFEDMIRRRRVRPTALLPLWHLAGFALGAGTALLGPRAAMACTVAVEEAIDEHYAAQRDALPAGETELKDTIEKFRQEELEHRDIGLANEAELAPAYRVLSAVIKRGCKAAIWASERL